MSLICRQLEPEDEPMVSEWLERDPIHKAAGIKWEHVIAKDTYAEIIMDEDGIILEVIRYHIALRVAMQFNPDASYRIAKHSKEVVELIKNRAKEANTKEIIILPGGKAVQFADKLGFEDFTGSKIIRIGA